MKKTGEVYLVEAVARACDLILAFHHEGEILRLRDLVSRTGLNPATALRLLSVRDSRPFGFHDQPSRSSNRHCRVLQSS